MTNQTSGISRRSIAKGAAWSVPAVAVAASAPAVAASCTIPADTIAGQVDANFTAYKDTLAQVVTQCGANPKFAIWYDGAGGSNGFLQNSTINARNISGCAIDTTRYPLNFRIDVKNLTGNITTDRRGFSMSTGYGSFENIAHPGKPVASVGANARDFTQPDASGVYSILFRANKDRGVATNEDIDINFQWLDGTTKPDGTGTQPRIQATYQLVPLGFAPPTLEKVLADLGITTADPCYANYVAAYEARYQQWITNGEGCQGVKWNVATDVTATRYGRGGYTLTPITCGTSMFAYKSRDFTPSHDGIY
ncbi:hypothetical protein ACFFHC_10255 [Kytococcus schroeteri]|uniref:hypothetical protein n=1 Tax=Kytococcus schroeteri TaxID=138300 RepID=UPI0035ED924D